MRITSKGQVTIPQEFREALGLFPESEVEFYIEDEHLVLKKSLKQEKHRLDNFIQQMRGKATVKMTTDEIMRLTRD